jgi:alpha,alpha-trehalase
MTTEEQLKKHFSSYKSEVKKKAKGALKYDYLVPCGPYQEQWDWDSFFIGVALASEIPSEAIYMKNCALNYLNYVNNKTGFTPGLVTPRGRDNRLYHVKPFLVQQVYFAAKNLEDFSWIEKYFDKLEKAATYRERYMWSKKYNLAMWYDGMECGADNNVVVAPYPKKNVIGADLNTFLYREYKCLSLIAHSLGKRTEENLYKKKAQKIKRNINKYLWDDKDNSYYNLNIKDGKLIKRHTYSNFIPLWEKLLPEKEGKEMIRKYMLNPKKLWSKYGVRTLAHDDPNYNNRAIIKPCSNWQGPVWPIVNYFCLHVLLNYGFKKEAKILAKKITNLCLKDIKTTGGMHENYHADSGKPLCAPKFVSWNLLASQMSTQARTGFNFLKIS